ncbi:MAG TPA: anthrone oxygenase family protein [Actinophytocola sp.]|jgi:uncharacterized membrane protein|nr:anthrone oxygenase family protein [Actinophytocola sp.]
MFVVASIVAVVSLVLTAAVSGVFFAFSNSVVPGLDAIRPEQAITAMTSINRTILNPLFLATFVGPPIAAVLAGVLIMVAGGTGGGLLFLAAAVVYALACIAPTAAVNVPLNNALDTGTIPTDADEVGRTWTGYSARWTRWNHWRAAGSLVAVALSGVGLLVWGFAD